MHLRDRPGGEAQGRYGADRAEEYVEQARSAGVDEIGFTDHVYHFRQSESLWEIGWMRERCTDDLDEYVGAVEEAKAARPARQARARGRLLPGNRARARRAARAVPLGLPARLGALRGRVPGRPGARARAQASGRRGLAPLLRLAAQRGSQRALRRPFSPGPDQVLRPASRPRAAPLHPRRDRGHDRGRRPLHRGLLGGAAQAGRARCTPTASCSPPVTIEACRSPQPRMHTSPRTSAATSIAPWSRRARPATTR